MIYETTTENLYAMLLHLKRIHYFLHIGKAYLLSVRQAHLGICI